MEQSFHSSSSHHLDSTRHNSHLTDCNVKAITPVTPHFPKMFLIPHSWDSKLSRTWCLGQKVGNANNESQFCCFICGTKEHWLGFVGCKSSLDTVLKVEWVDCVASWEALNHESFITVLSRELIIKSLHRSGSQTILLQIIIHLHHLSRNNLSLLFTFDKVTAEHKS